MDAARHVAHPSRDAVPRHEYMLPLSQGRETEYCGETELLEGMGYTGM